ncbi:MAG: RluA family pseudouridine synthase [Nitrospirae bacterium]|nr:MAG: RluA family pseudouridine synthase [Nitrospirota bacterium]
MPRKAAHGNLPSSHHPNHILTTTELIVTAGESPKRLDQFLANREPRLSRTALQRLILEGHITVGGQPVKPSHKIKPGDRIRLCIPRPQPLEINPEPIPLEILYEDEAILVLNKQAGLVVHPAPGNWTGTLVNALLHHMLQTGSLSTIGGKERPGLVHRLDKETSGVMVVAKQDEAHAHLAAQFKRHSILRIYEALVWKGPRSSRGTIELAIGRDARERKKFSSRTMKPKPSATEYVVHERLGALAAHVVLYPRTGRTHQLRVHLATMGCPILGDRVYGGKKVMVLGAVSVPRVMLHARVLGFLHPVTKEAIRFEADMPQDMQEVLAQLRVQAEADLCP